MLLQKKIMGETHRRRRAPRGEAGRTRRASSSRRSGSTSSREPFGNSVHQTRSGVTRVSQLARRLTGRPRCARSPLASRLRRCAPREFGAAIERHVVSCGDTIVYVDPRAQLTTSCAWLQGHARRSTSTTSPTSPRSSTATPSGRSRSSGSSARSPRKADLRVKVALDKRAPLEVPIGVGPLARAPTGWSARCYDMFGITLRRPPGPAADPHVGDSTPKAIPLRKDFPLRGHFSRAEQTRQALAANPEAHYSMEELSIAEAFDELPEDMRERLARGERGFLR